MVKKKPTAREAKLPSVQIGVRFPGDLLRQIEAFAATKAKASGIPVNRTEAIVYLVRRGFDWEAEGGTRP